jgi:hypothetical protein
LSETLFGTLAQARVALEEWRRDYNTERPHSALCNLTPIAYAARNASTLLSGTGRQLHHQRGAGDQSGDLRHHVEAAGDD